MIDKMWRLIDKMLICVIGNHEIVVKVSPHHRVLAVMGLFYYFPADMVEEFAGCNHSVAIAVSSTTESAEKMFRKDSVGKEWGFN